MPLENDAAYICPYCGEHNYTGVDASGGGLQRLIEDCPVCCRPIALVMRIDRDGDALVESAEPYVSAAFIACDAAGTALGFFELNLRPYAEGTENSPVPHIEGWYVMPHARRCGTGRALMQAAEDWAQANGYSEMTSDTTADYPDSIPSHEASGFHVVERLVALHKQLTP